MVNFKVTQHYRQILIKVNVIFRSAHLLLEGAELVLACPLAQGVPAPEVNWYHESDLVDRGRAEVREDHGLAIYSVSKRDAGLYTCKAINSEGSDYIRVR